MAQVWKLVAIIPALCAGEAACPAGAACPAQGSSSPALVQKQSQVSRKAHSKGTGIEMAFATFPMKSPDTSLLAFATAKNTSAGFCITAVASDEILSDTVDEYGEEHIKGINVTLDNGQTVRLMTRHPAEVSAALDSGSLCCKGHAPQLGEDLVGTSCSSVPAAALVESPEMIVHASLAAKDGASRALAAVQIAQAVQDASDSTVFLVSDSTVHDQIVQKLGELGKHRVVFHWGGGWVEIILNIVSLGFHKRIVDAVSQPQILPSQAR